MQRSSARHLSVVAKSGLPLVIALLRSCCRRTLSVALHSGLPLDTFLLLHSGLPLVIALLRSCCRRTLSVALQRSSAMRSCCCRALSVALQRFSAIVIPILCHAAPLGNTIMLAQRSSASHCVAALLLSPHSFCCVAAVFRYALLLLPRSFCCAAAVFRYSHSYTVPCCAPRKYNNARGAHQCVSALLNIASPSLTRLLARWPMSALPSPLFARGLARLAWCWNVSHSSLPASNRVCLTSNAALSSPSARRPRNAWKYIMCPPAEHLFDVSTYFGGF